VVTSQLVEDATRAEGEPDKLTNIDHRVNLGDYAAWIHVSQSHAAMGQHLGYLQDVESSLGCKAEHEIIPLPAKDQTRHEDVSFCLGRLGTNTSLHQLSFKHLILATFRSPGSFLNA